MVDVDLPRHVPAAEHARVRALREHGDLEAGDRVEVAHPAVGHDAGRAAHLRAQREHVADGSGAALAAGLDHEHLARLDGVERDASAR